MATTAVCDVESLPNIFNEGLDLYNNLGKIDEPTNSPAVQVICTLAALHHSNLTRLFQSNVKKAMNLLETATRLVSVADLFSENENIDEIATNDLQYLLLPALLGSLALKLTSGNRRDIVNCADVYFKDFLRRCNNYSLSNYEFKDSENKEDKEDKPKTEFEVIQSQVNTRANKIQKYKEQKELQAKLEDLKKNVENEHCDEEIKRDYFLTMIKSFIHQAIDELSSIEMEKDILEHMAKMNPNEKPKKGPQPKPLKPIIITRDEVQKAVFGAGYPSLPTMTVDEFYEKRVKEGIFPDHSKNPPVSLQDNALGGGSLKAENEEEEKEKLIEQDDEQLLEQMRQMDEFKDEHRRGWGNRMNRS